MSSECVWSASHGKSGFKASVETVKVWYRPDDDEYLVRFGTPIGSHDKGTFDDEDAAIERGKEVAANNGIVPEN